MLLAPESHNVIDVHAGSSEIAADMGGSLIAGPFVCTAPERMICAPGLIYTYCFSRHSYSVYARVRVSWIFLLPMLPAGLRRRLDLAASLVVAADQPGGRSFHAECPRCLLT